MTSHPALRTPLPMCRKVTWMLVLVAITAAIFSTPLLAQQTGEITGRVTDASDGSAISAVAIEATSPVLPGVRTSTTSDNGDYKLSALPPGTYTLKFTLSDATTRTRVTNVLLQQRTIVNLPVDFNADAGVLEEVIVVGTSTIAPDTGGASLAGAIGTDLFEALPVGQEYRDLIKLIPGVQYTQDEVRGPSAGGSGQDNVYQFDGVDVSLPMYGTLSAEPSTHDIDQISIVRGGAKAIGFNRSGGFKVNTISKRGTDEWHGAASYTVEDSGLTASRQNTDDEFDQDSDWLVASLGGPIIQEKLYFYGSFYRPTVTRNNRDNAYGAVPKYESTRDEYFGKLTWAPTENLLFDASYRTSDRTVTGAGVDTYETADGSTGSENGQDIGIVEGSWIINDRSSAYFKYTDFTNKGTSRPDLILDAQPAIGASLDLNNLDRMGHFQVPIVDASDPVQAAWAQELINRYGYIENGQARGGGLVGAGTDFDTQDFFRESFEIGYDLTLESESVSHDLHAGYHQEKIDEHLIRSSNGWGYIDSIGGVETASDGTPIFFQALPYQTSLGEYGVPPIDTGAKSRNIELNDTMYWKDFTFNVGVLFSEDKLYGQGLEKADTISGFVVAPGNRYMMKKVSFGDMVQPRLGITWDANDSTSVFANFSRYNPSASSLPRAAAWDRNLHSTIEADFDIDGNMIEAETRQSSSGKFFQEGIDPRYTDEYLAGVNWDVSETFSTRIHARYRRSRNFWEDTWNGSRVGYSCTSEPERFGCMPSGWAPEELYLPELDAYRLQLGNGELNGSSYVIAQLDRSYTDYYEVSFEGEWQYENFYLTGSYTWSQYKGNFDQDNTSSVNDANRFVGSSNLADGRGRQLWNMKDGTLRGDRTHLFKFYGYYDLPWNAQTGFYALYQSGQPWETWDGSIYGYSSDTIRYAEKAGKRRSGTHVQLDLNYVQNFYLGSGDRYTIQLRADLFNAFNNQTGYNVQPSINEAGYGKPRNYYNPRRLQLMAKFLF
jgi:hypothetical protein